MPLKTYVLLPVLDADAPVYQKTVDDKRIQLKKIPVWSPYLRMTYQDEKGVSRTIRYKSTAVDENGKTVLDQREQIDKLKIDANTPFTNAERKDLEFKNGVCFTAKVSAQDYLEAYPAIEGFKGTCDEIREPLYKLLDETVEIDLKNEDMKRRVQAGSKIFGLDLPKAQEMLIRLNGSFFKTPTAEDYSGTEKEKTESAIKACQNMLMAFLDDAEDAGLDAILKEDSETTVDEKTTVFIGKLINAGLLSFDAMKGEIAKKDKDGKWITVRSMSDEYSIEERKRLFSDFLNTDDGKALKTDLEKDLKATAKKQIKEELVA